MAVKYDFGERVHLQSLLECGSGCEFGDDVVGGESFNVEGIIKPGAWGT